MEKIIKFGKIKLTVASATVADGLTAERLKLAVLECEPPNADGYYVQFGRCVAQTKETQGLSFDIRVTPSDGKDKIYAIYQSFLGLPETLFFKWVAAVNEVNASEDTDFLPNENQT